MPFLCGMNGKTSKHDCGLCFAADAVSKLQSYFQLTNEALLTPKVPQSNIPVVPCCHWTCYNLLIHFVLFRFRQSRPCCHWAADREHPCQDDSSLGANAETNCIFDDSPKVRFTKLLTPRVHAIIVLLLFFYLSLYSKIIVSGINLNIFPQMLADREFIPIFLRLKTAVSFRNN